jgi:serine/threonine protein kinase
MVDTGRLIHRRYLLQRLIQRGTVCPVYQAFDQVLQRPVAIKIAPAEYIAAYRAALRSTAQFAHPNIIGIYDLVVEPDALYVVEEYVDGADFRTLLQSQLSPYQIADIGAQICRALLYAGTPSRKVCHGDLTPSAILRDRHGLVHVNNFALPSDMAYFSAWSVVGGGDIVFSEPNLPWGQMSDGRKEDDTRAVGLLLYQLLATGHSAGTVSAEPPSDGRLHFMRNVPAELCELTARAVVRKHPEHITTPEVLHTELKALTEALELASPHTIMAPEPVYSTEDIAKVKQDSRPSWGGLFPQMPPASPIPSPAHMTEEEMELNKRVAGPMIATEAVSLSSPNVANVSMQLATARQAAYGNLPNANHVNMPVLLAIGLVLFALFFGVGWMLAHLIFH